MMTEKLLLTKIEEMQKRGLSVVNISRVLGYSFQHLYRILNKNGVKVKSPKEKNVRRDVTLKKVRDLRMQGFSTYTIARKLNCSETCIRNRLKIISDTDHK